MSLPFAILGLLTFEPMSGYTLKTRYFDGSIAHFWPADQSQIYRTLQALESDGDVVGREAASDQRPKSRIYAITEIGQARLHAWLAQARPSQVQRNGFLVQLYFGRLLSRDQLLAVLKARREEHVQQRDYFLALQMPVADSDEMRRQLIFGGMTLDLGRRRETMMVEWLDACIATVSALE